MTGIVKKIKSVWYVEDKRGVRYVVHPAHINYCVEGKMLSFVVKETPIGHFAFIQ